MSLLNSPFAVLTGASWYLLEKIVRLVGAFLIGAWVARYLGPESYGSLAYVLALIALLGFLGSLGIETLVVRDLVYEQVNPRRTISTYFFIRLVGGLLVPLLATMYLAISHTDPLFLVLLAAICSGAVIFGAFDVADCWLQAKQKAKVTSSIRLAGFFAGASLKCLLIVIEASVEWFALAVLVEAAVMACLYFCLLSSHGLVPSAGDFKFNEFKRILADGKMMALSGLLVAVYSKIDILVVGTLLSKEALAPYAVAASMCAAWNMMGLSLVQAWAPRISSAFQAGRDQYVTELRKMLLVVLGLGIAGSGALSVISGYIFNILLGEEYAPGVALFNLLVWASVFVFIGTATSQIIVNEKIYWVSLLRTFLGVLFSLLLVLPAAQYFDAQGVAGVVVASSFVATIGILFSSSARRTLRSVMFS